MWSSGRGVPGHTNISNELTLPNLHSLPKARRITSQMCKVMDPFFPRIRHINGEPTLLTLKNLGDDTINRREDRSAMGGENVDRVMASLPARLRKGVSQVRALDAGNRDYDNVISRTLRIDRLTIDGSDCGRRLRNDLGDFRRIDGVI